MESNVVDSVLSVCKTLNKFSVEYLIVGGVAVALHGYFRHSQDLAGKIADKPDLDFWYHYNASANTIKPSLRRA